MLGAMTRPPSSVLGLSDAAKTWALNRRFKEGDVILIQGCADDFCNIIVPRQPGRSPEIELRIVSKGDLAKLLDDGLGQAQQELVRIQKMQQDAIDLVKQIDKAKEPQQKLDRLVEAEQIQKQIQERESSYRSDHHTKVV